MCGPLGEFEHCLSIMVHFIIRVIFACNINLWISSLVAFCCVKMPQKLNFCGYPIFKFQSLCWVYNRYSCRWQIVLSISGIRSAAIMHASLLNTAHGCLYAVTTDDTYAWLRGLFRDEISMVSVRVTSPCGIWCDSWYQTTIESLGYSSVKIA